MQVNHRPVKILIGGKSGSGKTTYLLRYVKNSSFRRYFIFDHKMEFQNRLRVEPCFSLEACAERLGRGERFISYHYSEEFPGEPGLGFQCFSEWSYEICKALEEEKDGAAGNSLYVCDEVNRFTTPSDLGDGFKFLIEDGRLQGLDLVATSHAANQISNRLRLQLTEIVALETHDKRPLAFLEESGFDPDEVEALHTGEFIVKNLDSDTFTRGKLFSRQDSPETVEPEIEGDESPSDENETPEAESQELQPNQ